jgi:hypothetical protein
MRREADGLLYADRAGFRYNGARMVATRLTRCALDAHGYRFEPARESA